MFSFSLLSLSFFLNYRNSPECQSVFTVKKLYVPFLVFSWGEVERFSKNEGAGRDEQQEVTKGSRDA